jgi:hypothetical protein
MGVRWDGAKSYRTSPRRGTGNTFWSSCCHTLSRTHSNRDVAAQESRDTVTAWKEKKDATPSVCDWMLLGEGHCVVIDATNHAVKADAAQGMATFEE